MMKEARRRRAGRGETLKGTTEAEIRAHLAGASPTSEFCHNILTATWTANEGADLIQLGHLVEENSLFLGGANIRMMG
jgi:hypothetical protein